MRMVRTFAAGCPFGLPAHMPELRPDVCECHACIVLLVLDHLAYLRHAPVDLLVQLGHVEVEAAEADLHLLDLDFVGYR